MTNHTTLDTRERLVEAAMELLWRRGYTATSVDDLCRMADARKGSFYHYFPSKSDLAIAAIQTSWGQTRSRLFEPLFRDRMSGLKILKGLFRKVDEIQSRELRDGGAFLGCRFGTLGQEMAHRDDRLRQLLQEVFRGHCEYIEKALRCAQKDGEIPRGNNRRRAQRIFALMEGALLLAKVSNDPEVFRSIAPSLLTLASS